METINDRIEKLIEDYFDGNKASFAKTIGLAPTGLSNYLGKQRRSKPSVDMIIKIITHVDVDPIWLLLGDNSTNNVHTEGDFSPASINGNSQNKNIHVNEAPHKDTLIKENEKLTIENEMLKRLLEEKDNTIKEKERFISFLTANK